MIADSSYYSWKRLVSCVELTMVLTYIKLDYTAHSKPWSWVELRYVFVDKSWKGANQLKLPPWCFFCPNCRNVLWLHFIKCTNDPPLHKLKWSCCSAAWYSAVYNSKSKREKNLNMISANWMNKVILCKKLCVISTDKSFCEMVVIVHLKSLPSFKIV